MTSLPLPPALSRIGDRLGRRVRRIGPAWLHRDRGGPVEWAARTGYAARGFVYLSAGVLTLLAATDHISDALGSSAAAGWLAGQPLGRVWLVLLGLGLWAFVLWRAAQALFDADHEGRDARGLLTRAGQALSGLFYGLLASAVFEYLDEVGRWSGRAAAAEDVAENQAKAALILDLPFGRWLLALIGLVILAGGVAQIVRAGREDFAAALRCSETVCRRVTPLARAGYAARGVAWLPLGLLVLLAGLADRPQKAAGLGAALDALEAQPGGGWMLGATAVGLMAFGAFALVEARYRRIRAPRELNPLA